MRVCSRCGCEFQPTSKSVYCKPFANAIANARYRGVKLELTPYQLERRAQREQSNTKHPRYQAWINMRRQIPTLTFELMQEFEERFTGKCDICDAEIDGRNRHLDHCHETGVLRGWLCPNCNLGLGHFKDSPELLAAAIGYLKKISAHS